jgi:hypothetical protein
MYSALILPDVPIDKSSNDKLWKLKIPLKIKVFGWYLCKGVVLTKDNLAKRNWHGSKKCVFCPQDETIKHLFFQCHFARSIWSVIQVNSTLIPPCSITNIFGNWLNGIDNRFKKHIRVGAIAFIWSLWLCRNDKVFNDKNSSILQVIYRAIGTLCLWLSLQRPQDRDLYTKTMRSDEMWVTICLFIPIKRSQMRRVISPLSILHLLMTNLAPLWSMGHGPEAIEYPCLSCSYKRV